MKLIVGLGNPGAKYQGTRHNIGFLVVDRLAQQNNIVIGKQLCNALVAEGLIGAERCALAKPQTFMNRSGLAVKGLIEFFSASAQDLVVVYDDLDLPFGRMRIRPDGGAGGHRGISSIIESLAQAPFCRVRFGIGRPPEDMDPADYVLEPFNAAEAAELTEKVDRTAAAVSCLLSDGLERAMERFNRAL